MTFPDAPRVLYSKSPLYEVTAKLQFPPILRIDSESPTAFQEAIRGEFPYYSLETVKPTGVKSPPKPGQVLRIDISPNRPVHVFATADGHWVYRLKFNELSLTCRRYSRWEPFCDRLHLAFDALKQVYVPAFYSHVCVKYKNAIIRSSVGSSESEGWSELLRTHVIGPVGEVAHERQIVTYQNKFVSVLEQGLGRIDATFSIGTSANPSVREKAFLIDAHVYVDGQTRAQDVFPKLDSFRRVAGRFFRWCITDRLHSALGPTAIVDDD